MQALLLGGQKILLFGRAYIAVLTKNFRTVNSIAPMTLAHGKAAHIVQAIGITSPYGASKAVSLGFFGPIPHQPKWELSVESEMQLI